ncbi:MAG: ThuA domain-containing protein [Planctomycetaceae bacterium]
MKTVKGPQRLRVACRLAQAAFVSVCLFACAIGNGSSAVAVEPWADDQLSITEGLVVWLDAATIQAARKTTGLTELKPGDPIQTWPNACSQQPDFVQNGAEAQPTYQPTGDFQAIRFEARGQHLRMASPLPPASASTVFIVAAPHSSPEAFSAFLSTSVTGKNDFQTGLNIDQALGDQNSLKVVNVEGRGSPGMNNLLKEPLRFGAVARLCVTSRPGDGGIQLWANGKLQGTRDRAASDSGIGMEEIVLGGRYYTLGGSPEVRGFFHGDIAEVLIYDRLLPESERTTVDRYLADKYGSVADLPLPQRVEGSEPLVRVDPSVPVQVFMPGFTVRQLPLDLTNINNVKYRPDGVLVALGYDGRVWHLRDTDGDGLEDHASLFWDNPDGLRAAIGMDLTPPGYERGNGVIIVTKTRCSLIVDTDGDDKADQDIEVAGGWQEGIHGVDALGVAFDPRDGSVYYGRGTNNFTDPLLRDKAGRPGYSLDKESGVVIRVAPNFKTREIFATGIRFPVSIRFNRHGDLFCTDQEGATWVPNGNPLDELLHVQKGRHYGFPARHPTHLPDVIDEPSTFDYGPQHQSTCGLCFNEPVVKDGPTFGPKAWAGDAFVTGYSRGKLYRTQLVKTESGYVARNHLFACLDRLTADCCIAPDGSMVVTCHSGGPDWGSGPTGKGVIYKISYSAPELAQPVFAWPSTVREVRIEFDRPVDPERLHDVLQQTSITSGEFVRAGDRFESLWPGYAVVQAQQRSPRFPVRVHAAQLTADRRTLVLATDAMQSAVHYAVTLPGLGRADQDQVTGELLQAPQVDLDFDLSGIAATWSEAGQVVWSGWLPSLDLTLSRQWTAGSAYHDLLWQAMKNPGDLVLATQLNLRDMLRPAVQPGSRIDYELPPEHVVVRYTSTLPVEAHSTTASRDHAPDSGTRETSNRGQMTYDSDLDELVPIEFRLHKSDSAINIGFTATYSTKEDPRWRPFPLHRMFLPWAVPPSDSAAEPVMLAKELEGGDWGRGRKLYFGEQAGCSKCHAVHRQGGSIGPDLSNLIHRDYASVMRDITQPNFAINPDYVASSLVLTDGRVISGVVRSIDDNLHVGDQQGKTIVIPKSDIEQLRASSVSVMPENVLKTMDASQIRDLLTFLLTPGPSMPRDYAGGPRPKPRSAAEVQRVLAGSPQPPEPTRSIQIVLVAGPKDHGPGEHDYPAWQKAWQQLLSAGENVEVATAWEWPSADQLKTADAIVFYQHGDWNIQRAADIDQYLKRGGGLVYIHWAVDGRQHGDEFAQRIGLAGRGMVGFRHGDLTLSMNGQSKHPVIRNFSELAMTDETYWKMVGNLRPDQILATAIEDKAPQPQVWSLEHGTGRVFVSIPGHYSWTFDDPLFRVLLLRGIAWSAKEPVDRFNELVWPGADVTN